jgi:hypothetical protein
MVLDDAGQAIVALGVCATIATTVVAVARAYVRGVEAQRKPRQAELAPDVQDRMSRIEQAVDAIAIEVERMSEGQRFTTRLLAERFGDQGRGLTGGMGTSATHRSGEHGTNGAGGTHDR